MKPKHLSEFIRYVTLSVLGMLGLSCYILADTWFISRALGEAGLTALNLAIPVYSLIHGCGLMLGSGGAVHFVFDRSRGEARSMAFTHSLCMGAVLALGFVLAGGFGSDAITHLLGADAAAFADTRTYLRMLLLCAPAFLLNDILISFARSDGRPRLAMAAMLTGSFSNILLDYIFIFPCNMGIFGAVLATCLAPVIGMAVLFGGFLMQKAGFAPMRRLPRSAGCIQILASGAPALAAELSSGVVMVVFNLLMLRFAGNTGVAAYGVIANISLVVTAVFTGIGQGMQPLISLHHGEGNRIGTRALLRYGLVTAAGLGVLITAALLLLADPLTTLFNSEHLEELQDLAVSGMHLYFTGTVLAGVNIVLSVWCIATERTVCGNLISVLRGFALILPLACLLPLVLALRGLWLAYPAAELLTLCCACLLLIGSRKKFLSACSKSEG